MWEQISLIIKGRNYLLAVDYYSRDVEICIVSKTCDTAETILKVKKIFSRHGICDIFFTDNGPQFASSDSKSFANEWGFEHITSSPRYPQSNGEAERAEQTVKSILNKCQDEYLALLMHRNTPLHNGYSPAQLAMGRRLKTRVPCDPEDLKPKWPDQTILRRKEKAYREKMKSYYDNRHRVRDQSPLSPGDRVWIPDLQSSGIISRRSTLPRSLIVDTPRSTVRRNQRMLRRSLEQEFHAETEIQGTPVHGNVNSKIEFPTSGSEGSTSESSAVQDQPTACRRSGRVVKHQRRYIEC